LVLGTTDPACTITDLSTSFTIPMAQCGIVFDGHTMFVVTTLTEYVTTYTVFYNVSCQRDSRTSVDMVFTINGITEEDDDTQNIFDTAHLVDLSMVDPDTDQVLTTAHLGQSVKLRVSLAQVFRTNFGIRVDGCTIGGIPFYNSSYTVTPLFGGFDAEVGEVVYASTFNLFRPRTTSQDTNRQLEYVCAVTTCFGTCTPPSGRKRRSIGNRSGYRYALGRSDPISWITLKVELEKSRKRNYPVESRRTRLRYGKE